MLQKIYSLKKKRKLMAPHTLNVSLFAMINWRSGNFYMRKVAFYQNPQNEAPAMWWTEPWALLIHGAKKYRQFKEKNTFEISTFKKTSKKKWQWLTWDIQNLLNSRASRFVSGFSQVKTVKRILGNASEATKWGTNFWREPTGNSPWKGFYKAQIMEIHMSWLVNQPPP